MLGLNARQRAFVANYRGNATQAAREAGYKGSEKALGVQGVRLMKNPKVQAALRARAAGAGLAKSGEKRPSRTKEDAPSLPKGVLTLEERLRVLSELAAADTVDPKDRIRAVEVLTKLCGDGQPAPSSTASANATAQVVVWVGNERGPSPS